MLGIALDDPLKLRARVVPAFLRQQQQPQVIPGLQVFRIELNRLAIRLLRRCVIAGVHLQARQMEIGRGIIGLEPEHRLVVRQGALATGRGRIFKRGQSETRLNVIGLEADGLFEQSARLLLAVETA